MLSDEQKQQLAAKLPADAVKTRDQGGQRLAYIDGHFAISQANEVFGPDGWSYQVDAITEVYRGERDGKSGKNLVIVYEARVTVTALGVTRSDVGIGQCDSGERSLALTIEKARKEAATDGLKRALRTFGPRFGLALYDKTQADVGESFDCQSLLASLAAAPDPVEWATEHADACRALSDGERAQVRAAVQARRDAAAKAKPAPVAFPVAPPVAPPVDPTEAALEAIASAATLSDLDAVLKRFSAALATRPEAERALARDAVRERRAHLQREQRAAQLLAEAGRATTEAVAHEVYARLTAAALAGQVTEAQAAAVTEALNERLSIAQPEAA